MSNGHSLAVALGQPGGRGDTVESLVYRVPYAGLTDLILMVRKTKYQT